MKIRSTISWFMGFTSIGGLSHSHSTDGERFKPVWIILFITGTALTAWTLWGITVDYLQKPVRISLESSVNIAAFDFSDQEVSTRSPLSRLL